MISISESRSHIGFGLNRLVAALVFTVVLAVGYLQSANADSPLLCWDGVTPTYDLKSCPPEPKRLCENGTSVPVTQKYCSVSIIELQLLDNPLGHHMKLSVRVEDGLVKSYRTLTNRLKPQVSIRAYGGKIISDRYYTDRPSDWEQRTNHETCPFDVVSLTCKRVMTSTEKPLGSQEVITFVETSYYPDDLIDYPEIQCLNEQIISHVESHQSGVMPPLSVNC